MKFLKGLFHIVLLTFFEDKIATKFMRNTGWLLFEQIFRMGLSLVVTSLMARYLGAEDFGMLNYGLAYIIIFTTVSNLGIDSIIVNEIIKNREDTGKIIGTTLYLRFISSVISIFSIFIIVNFFDANNITIQVITCIQSFSLLFIVFDSIGYWFQSNLQSKYIVIAKSVAFVIVSVWRLALIFLGKSIEYFAVATVIEAIIMSAFIFIFYTRFEAPKLRYSFQTAKQLLSQCYHFLIAGILIMVYTQIDKLMLGQMTGNTTVGVYSAALVISSLWMFIPNALIHSARPLIMASKNQDEDLYIKRNKQLYCSIIWIGIGASIVITLFSKPIILLIYGDQFIEAVHVLVILIWSRIFALIGTIKSIWLTSENLSKYLIIFVGIAAFVNVALNLILIPKYGAIGAAIATLFAEVLSALFANLFFKKTRPLFKLIIESILFKGVRAKIIKDYM